MVLLVLGPALVWVLGVFTWQLSQVLILSLTCAQLICQTALLFCLSFLHFFQGELLLSLLGLGSGLF